MSVDKSLKLTSSMARQRSVLSRAERLEKLKDEGKWSEEDSVFGLPKVRVRRMKRRAKAAKAEETAEAAPGAEGEARAAEAADSKG